MKILAVDTANNSCSAAISDKKKLLAETSLITTTTHSKHLMKIIEKILDLSGLDLSLIDLFAVSIGPGSFTGLRIGISTVLGLAKSLDKPIVGISALDALAFQFSFVNMPIYSLIDARRQEVYCAVYQFANQGILKSKSTEKVAPPQVFLENIEQRCLFVGSGALFYKELIQEQLGDKAIFVPYYLNTIKASVVAMQAFENMGKDKYDLPIIPKYIRKSDAEINFNKA